MLIPDLRYALPSLRRVTGFRSAWRSALRAARIDPGIAIREQ
jgi:hypothetical protein